MLHNLIVSCICTIGFLLLQCSSPAAFTAYKNTAFEIIPLSKNAYQVISYLDIPNYGPFPCNSLLYVQHQEVVLFDTPPSKAASSALIQWIQNQMGYTIKGIVVNHFHDDCLGGLDAFHAAGIPSYALQRTIDLAEADQLPLPQHGFEEKLLLQLGLHPIVNQYFGEAHTVDNIVSYLPDEQLLFGGCMIKAMNARKGNVKDANLKNWAKTVARVKAQFPDIQIVLPGHGNAGGPELLDYTIQLFSEKE